MDDRTRVLVVEDDANIVDLLRANLSVRGFAVVVSRTGTDALSLYDDVEPELVLVDLMLPGLSGFEVCRHVRQRGAAGIIVLSARADETDKVKALNIGADDYLTKPFGIEELLARIHATLRRARPHGGEANGPAGPVQVGEVVIDVGRQLVTRSGVPVRLAPTEFALLAQLALQPGDLVSHTTLLRRVWGPGYAANTEYTRVYVRRLRAKLEDPAGPPVILTEPRRGYRLAVDVGQDPFTRRS